MLPPDGDRNAGFQKDFQSYRSLEGKAFLVYGLSLIFFHFFGSLSNAMFQKGR